MKDDRKLEEKGIIRYDFVISALGGECTGRELVLCPLHTPTRTSENIKRNFVLDLI